MNFLFSQEKVYLDENMNHIDKKAYKKKCKLNIYKCKRHKTDTTVINKIYDKYEFGKVSSEDLQILKTFFSNNSEIEFNPTTNTLVKYNDSIFGYKTTEERRKRHYDKYVELFNNSASAISRKGKVSEFVPLTFKTYTKNHIEFIRKQKKCIEKANKMFNSKVFHVYQFDLGHNIMWSDLNWIHDKISVFKQYFFKMPNYNGMMILKPDGTFFVSNVILKEKMLLILLNGDWSTLKHDWMKTKQDYIKKGFGFFKTENNFKRQTCF